MTDPVISLLRDLVAIDSVNPSLVPGAAGEAQIAEAIARTCARSASTSRCRRPRPAGRTSSACSKGASAGASLMFCGHTRHRRRRGHDGAVRSGRARRPAVRPRLAGHEGGRRRDDRRRARRRASAASARGGSIVAAVVDEEYASIGADALVREWKADAAVVTEPTDLQIGDRPQGLCVGRDRDARPRRARQPARATGATRSCGWAACCTRLERSIASCRRGRRIRCMGTGVAARVDHRRAAAS